ncbi:MAG: hypothetical protein ACHRXM_11600 [Isosphaerales bacterium]
MTTPAPTGRDNSGTGNREAHEGSLVRDGTMGVALGALIGAAAGLIGVGGG